MLDDLIAVCGFSCAGCQAYKATKNNDREELARLADEWTKSLGKTYTPEDILCDGCRAGGRLVAYCSDCNIRVCALSKGYLTCAHCPGMPDCDKITQPKAREMLVELKKKLGI